VLARFRDRVITNQKNEYAQSRIPSQQQCLSGNFRVFRRSPWRFPAESARESKTGNSRRIRGMQHQQTNHFNCARGDLKKHISLAEGRFPDAI
jgi:hypothetical protein